MVEFLSTRSTWLADLMENRLSSFLSSPITIDRFRTGDESVIGALKLTLKQAVIVSEPSDRYS